MTLQKIVINKENFRKDIQVLRGVAVIAVMLFHYNSNLFQNGFLGVDIFFVISGYLISNIIYSEITNNTFTLGNFFIRRIRRIVPSLISLLVFVNIISFFVLNEEKVLGTFNNSVAALFFISNIFFPRINSYFGGEIEYNLIINLWSLSIEEQFYIVFPFLVLLLFRFNQKKHIPIFIYIFILSLISKSELFYSSFDFLNKIFFNLDGYMFYSPTVRVFEFLFGVLIMLIRFQVDQNLININGSFKNIIFIVLLFLLFFSIGIDNYILILIACTLTSLILFSNDDTNKFSFSNLKIIEYVGLISYSLYLFHQPILASIKNHNLNTTLYGKIYIDLTNIFNVLIIFIIIFFISFINFTFIEDKLRKSEFFQINYKKYLLTLVTLFGLVGAFISTSDGYGFRFEKLDFPSQANQYEIKFGTNYLIDGTDLCINKDYIEATCKFNQNTGAVKVYLIGNSEISSLTSGFLQNKYANKYSIIEYTRQGCSLRHKICDYYPGSLKYDELYYIENSIIILDSYEELNLVPYEVTEKKGQLFLNIESMSPEKRKDKIKNLELTIKRLAEKNNKIIILEPIPRPFVNLKMYEFVNNKSLYLNYNSWKNYKKNVLEIYDEINHTNFSTISLDEVFCNKSVCEFSNDSQYLYVDDAHLSYFGAQIVADEIIKSIDF